MHVQLYVRSYICKYVAIYEVVYISLPSRSCVFGVNTLKYTRLSSKSTDRASSPAEEINFTTFMSSSEG